MFRSTSTLVANLTPAMLASAGEANDLAMSIHLEGPIEHAAAQPRPRWVQ